jgi:hypothetical protein
MNPQARIGILGGPLEKESTVHPTILRDLARDRYQELLRMQSPRRPKHRPRRGPWRRSIP